MKFLPRHFKAMLLSLMVLWITSCSCKPFGKSFFENNHLDRSQNPVIEEEKKTSTTTTPEFQITQPNSFAFPSSFLKQDTEARIDFSNITSSSIGDDIGMSYTCVFDRVIDNSVSSGTSCSSLPGSASFSASTGVFSWTPDYTVLGIFEVKVTGTNGEKTAERFISFHVIENFLTDNLSSNFDSFFANLISPASSGLSLWKDLSSNARHASLVGDASLWGGDGSTNNPYRYTLNGTNYFDLGLNHFQIGPEFLIHTWVNPSAASSKNKVILDSSENGTNTGITLRQSQIVSGGVDFLISDGNIYSQLVMQDAPLCYWRLADTGSVVTDTMGYCANGSFTGTVSKGANGAITGDADKGVNFAGAGEITVPYNAGLNVGTGDFTVELWARSSYTGHYQILFGKISTGTGEGIILYTQVTTGVLRTWVNSTLVVWTKPFMDGNWHHVVLVRSSGNIYSYIDGQMEGPVLANLNAEIGSPVIKTGRGVFTDYPVNGSVDEIAFYNYALSTAQVQRHYQAGITAQSAICTSPSLLSNNQWYALSALFTSNVLKLFINGVQQCNLSSSATSHLNSALTTLGATKNSTNFFSGNVADTKIYTSSSQVASAIAAKQNFDAMADRYRTTKLNNFIREGLVLHLDPANYLQGTLFGGTGCALTSWFDLSSNSLTSTLTNFSACGLSSGFNGTGTSSDPYRLTFDGTNDHVVMTSAPSLYSNQDFTISAWYRGTDIAANGVWDKGIVAWDNVAVYGGLMLKNGYAKYIHYDDTDGGWTVSNPIQSPTLTADNTWHHITYVNYSDETGELFIDGGKVTNRLSSKMQSSGTRYPFVPAHLMRMVGPAYTSGNLGQVAVYNRALSTSEISRNCKALQSRFQNAVCN